MTDNQNELAAIAGVMALISSESSAGFTPRKPENIPSPWQAWGRSATMQYRDIIQRRIIKRHR